MSIHYADMFFKIDRPSIKKQCLVTPPLADACRGFRLFRLFLIRVATHSKSRLATGLSEWVL